MKSINNKLVIILVLLFSMICSTALTADEVTGVIVKKTMGNFDLKKENGETIRIHTGKKVTKFVPFNYRTLLEDKVKVTFEMRPLRYNRDTKTLKPVALKIEPVKKGPNHIDRNIVCEISEVGRRWIKATLIDRPLFLRLELWTRQTSYFPKGYDPQGGDIVSVYVEKRGDSWADKYRYIIWEIKKITEKEKEICLENTRRMKELKASSSIDHVDELLIDLNSIHFTGIRDTAKEIAENDYYKNKKLTDKISEILKGFIAKPDKSDMAVDAMCWCCMVLHKSMNKDYAPILQEVKSSKIDGKIRKYAKKALKAFKKAKV